MMRLKMIIGEWGEGERRVGVFLPSELGLRVGPGRSRAAATLSNLHLRNTILCQ